MFVEFENVHGRLEHVNVNFITRVIDFGNGETRVNSSDGQYVNVAADYEEVLEMIFNAK